MKYRQFHENFEIVRRNASLPRKTLKASSLEKSRFLDKKYLDVSNFYEISVEVLEFFFLVMTLKKACLRKIPRTVLSNWGSKG